MLEVVTMRYRFLAAGLVLAGCALIVVTSCSTDEQETEGGTAPSMSPVVAAAVVPCIGVPEHGGTAYQEKRVFLESQGWWGERRADGTVPKRGAAEHLHVGMCFPLQQTVSGTKTFIVRVMAHNLPLGSVIETTSLHDPGGGSIPDINWNYTVNSRTVERWDTVQVNTAFIPNGLREFRNLTSVRRPDGAEIHASSGWCWTIANGTTAPVASGTCETTPKHTMARGWYNCFEYKIAEARNWDYPYAGIARNASYTLQIGAREGAGDHNLITSWEVRLNPEFHAVPAFNGSLIASGTGPANGQNVTISGSLLTGPKVHRLVVIASSNDSCSLAGHTPEDGELSAVFAVPLKVN
jgi:hypothetical protein